MLNMLKRAWDGLIDIPFGGDKGPMELNKGITQAPTHRWVCPLENRRQAHILLPLSH